MAFLLAFGRALSVTIIIEVVRHVRGRGSERRGASRTTPARAALTRPARAAPTLTGCSPWSRCATACCRPAPTRWSPSAAAGRCSPGRRRTPAELAGDRHRRPPRRARRLRPRPLGRRPAPRSSTTTSSCSRRRPTAATSPPGWPTALGRPLLAGASSHADRGPPRPRRRPELHDVADPRTGRRHAAAGRPRRRQPRSARPRSGAPCRRRPSVPADPRMDATVVEVLPPDVTTMDLAEADADRRRRRRARRAGPLRPARRRRRRARRVDGRDAGHHRPRLGRPRAPDRHHRRRRRPRPLPRVRHQRRRAAHRRARHPDARRQRQHRPALPDDADGRPRRRRRRQRRARRARRAGDEPVGCA